MKSDFIIAGAGIFGICTGLVLRRAGHSVTVLNPGSIPHPLAASTDISKVIRMEYGSDTEYLQMTAASMEVWRTWNEEFLDTVYHEVGYLLLAGEPVTTTSDSYEAESYRSVLAHGYAPVRLSGTERHERYPAFDHSRYPDAVFHAVGGFAESGRAVELLAGRLRGEGGHIREHQTVAEILVENGHAKGVRTREGSVFEAGAVIVCAGNMTPYLVPDLMPFMRITGHPVFHLKPSDPRAFEPQVFPVFAADIANTGWYGFPFHPWAGVVKVANHGVGVTLHPEHDRREVYASDINHLRAFLRESIPSLADAPVVYTRRCCYTDTLDGHFWIDNHPEIGGLTIGSGGSGHGFKMAPVVGEMIATLALGGDHKWSDRYNWRELSAETKQQEEARNL